MNIYFPGGGGGEGGGEGEGGVGREVGRREGEEKNSPNQGQIPRQFLAMLRRMPSAADRWRCRGIPPFPDS